MKKYENYYSLLCTAFYLFQVKVNHGPSKGHTFVMWDVGGQESFRALWPTYLKNANAMIFILDASDSQKFEEAKVELDTVLNSLTTSQKFPIILLANKQDKPEAVPSKSVRLYTKKIIYEELFFTDYQNFL